MPAISLWKRLAARFQDPPIDDAPALRTFLEQRASLIAQKCAVDYVRGKTGLASHALFTEKPFLEAMDVCRWESFATVLGDLLILVESQLRGQAAGERQARLQAVLCGLYPVILRDFPLPAHRGAGWGDVEAAFEQRFQAAAHGRPLQALDVADHSAQRLFDTLPIHASMRELDQEVVYGAVRFRMIAVNQELQRRLRAPELVERLLLADQKLTL
jgi:hypothetical protein